MVAAYGGDVGGLSGGGGAVEKGGYVGGGDGGPCDACGKKLTSQGPAQRGNRAGPMWFAGDDGTGDVEESCAVAVCDDHCFLHLLPFLHDHLCRCQPLLGWWSWRGNALAYPEMIQNSDLLGSGLVDFHARSGTLTPGTEVGAAAERSATECPLPQHLQLLHLLLARSWPVGSLSAAAAVAVAAGRSAGPPSCSERCERGRTEEGGLAETAGIGQEESPSGRGWTGIGAAGQGSSAGRVFPLDQGASSAPCGSVRGSGGGGAGHAESAVRVMCGGRDGCAGEGGGNKGHPGCSGPQSPGSREDEGEVCGNGSVGGSQSSLAPRQPLLLVALCHS